MRKSLKQILKRNTFFYPSRSGFGVYKPELRQGIFLSPRERSYQITSFAQQGEDLILNRIFARRLGFDARSMKGFYVDIGAYHPFSHSTTFCLYKFGWSGVCIDISRESCDLISRFRPRDRVFQCAISGKDHEKNAVSAEGLSLINEVDNDLSKVTTNADLIDSRSLNSILDEIGREGRIDYLNIDVEGAEIDALEGLDFNLYSPRVISVEIHDRDMVSALETPAAKILRNQGYIPVGCAAITYFFIRDSEA